MKRLTFLLLTVILCSLSAWCQPSLLSMGCATTQTDDEVSVETIKPLAVSEDVEEIFAGETFTVPVVEGETFFERLLFSGACFIDHKRKEIEIPSNVMNYDVPLHRFYNLLEKNMFKFYDLEKEYPTPLQQSLYLKTWEGKQTQLHFNDEYKNTLEGEFYLLYNLYGNSPYNMKSHNFKFKIGINDFEITTKPGYLGIGENICLSFPQSKLTIRKTLTSYGDYWLDQYISTPSISEDLALKIEQAMSQYPCPLSLLFIVKIDGISKEKRTINFGGSVGRGTGIDNFLLLKPIRMYIINTDTEEEICNLSSIFQTK